MYIYIYRHTSFYCAFIAACKYYVSYELKFLATVNLESLQMPFFKKHFFTLCLLCYILVILIFQSLILVLGLNEDSGDG